MDPAYTLVAFDAQGNEFAAVGSQLGSALALAALGDEAVTDVFLMSHGWMGDIPGAIGQYDRWTKAMADATADVSRAKSVRPGFQPVVVGIHWPSKPWGNYAPRLEESTGPDASDEVAREVDDLITSLDAPRELAEPFRVIVEASRAPTAPGSMPTNVLAAYEAIDRASRLAPGGVEGAPGDDHDALDAEAWYQRSLALRARETGTIGEEAFGIQLPSADALLDPLRTVSFWKMKGRARFIGETALHPLLQGLLAATAGRDVRFHLMGHSFGCLVMSAAVAGPGGSTPIARPVHSMALLQGALSLWSFCSSIPDAPTRRGYFRSIIERRLVAGPIVTTQSSYDRALAYFYPPGVRLAGDFESTFADLPKYGAVGAYGIQGPGLALAPEIIKRANAPYAFEPGQVVNLESSGIIRNGGGVIGAHSDIAHPEVAHAVWSAALTG